MDWTLKISMISRYRQEGYPVFEWADISKMIEFVSPKFPNKTSEITRYFIHFWRLILFLYNVTINDN